MTSGPIRRPGSASGSARRSCPPGREVAGSGRGAATAVPAGPVHGDFVPALGSSSADGGAVRDGVTRLTAQWQDEQSLREAVAGRVRLRVLVGRRRPLQGPPRAGQGVPAGHDRGPRRRHRGARRDLRRLPGVHRVVGGSAARLQAPRDAGARPRGRRRGAGVLEGAARGVPRDSSSADYWFHKVNNILDALPKSAHAGAKDMLAEIYNAEDKDHAVPPQKRSPATSE